MSKYGREEWVVEGRSGVGCADAAANCVVGQGRVMSSLQWCVDEMR